MCSNNEENPKETTVINLDDQEPWRRSIIEWALNLPGVLSVEEKAKPVQVAAKYGEVSLTD